jgi:hypothetical protein
MKKKKLYSFAEARRMARGHGFSSYEEFVEYTCPGVYQIPKQADQIWKNEWTSWDDFLGIPWPFDEGRRVARQLNLSSMEEYLQFMNEKKLDDDDDHPAHRLPFRPDLHYRDDQWKGWEDWLYL